jgi:hypothetical protein
MRHDTGNPDWRNPEHYEHLLTAERSMFAWEWLRRTEAYRVGWRKARGRDRAASAASFGLAGLIEPTCAADRARPIWLSARDPRVLPSRARPTGTAEICDLLDVRRLLTIAAVEIVDDIECWRFGDAADFVRLDVANGTLLGGPTLIELRLTGMALARRLAPEAANLAALGVRRQLPRKARETRARRWVAELRAWDGLATGVTQQQIARTILSASDRDWRRGDESMRLRAQRLVRQARFRWANPLDPVWFAGAGQVRAQAGVPRRAV